MMKVQKSNLKKQMWNKLYDLNDILDFDKKT